MTETLVDARGLRCPWPALRLARAMREQGGTGRARIVADDPAAPREIAALAAERGWRCTPLAEGALPTFLIEAGEAG